MIVTIIYTNYNTSTNSICNYFAFLGIIVLCYTSELVISTKNRSDNSSSYSNSTDDVI